VNREHAQHGQAPDRRSERDVEGEPALGPQEAEVSPRAIMLALALLVVAVVAMFYLLPAWVNSGAVSVTVQP
jgi:hypothetical protein